MQFSELQSAFIDSKAKKYDCHYGLLPLLSRYVADIKDFNQTPDELAENFIEGHFVDRRYVSEAEWERALRYALFADDHYACLSFKH